MHEILSINLWLLSSVTAAALSHLYFTGGLLGLRAWGETAALSSGFVGLLGRLCSCRLCLTTWMGVAAALVLAAPTDPLSAVRVGLLGLSAGWSADALRNLQQQLRKSQ